MGATSPRDVARADGADPAPTAIVQRSVILFATDLAEPAEPSIEHARVVARLFDADVLLVHAQTSSWRGWVSSGLVERQAADRLERWAGELEARGVHAECAPVLRVHAAEAILGFGYAADVVLVVVGAAQRTPVQRLRGTTAETVARLAGPPVWVRRGVAMPVQRVLCGVDGSERSRQALSLAARIAQRAGASLVVASAIGDATLHALGASPDDVDAGARAYKRGRAAALDWFVDESELHGLRPERRWLWGHAEYVLAAQAADLRSDVLVLGRSGPGARRRLLGGTAERLLREAPCSILITSAAPVSSYPTG